ncbi:hypothetical protein B0J13DRAFT_217523 [Dactylonectria estremocensis]|uniref:Secreted protein n=1 Tax=Dactylonectria estremocensis TaxID=1079267 RepID=A0A9P9F7A3_9HYPO|nr:hypothetical protein B0J13DRAFT_217523 [Dactylonectria estremocensis]
MWHGCLLLDNLLGAVASTLAGGGLLDLGVIHDRTVAVGTGGAWQTIVMGVEVTSAAADGAAGVDKGSLGLGSHYVVNLVVAYKKLKMKMKLWLWLCLEVKLAASVSVSVS